MKLLEKDKLPVYEVKEYIRQARQFNITAPMGEYFVFTDRGDFIGYTDIENEKVYALLEEIPVEAVSHVKFKVYPFIELSLRHRVAVLNSLNKVKHIRMEQLMDMNPDILFSLDNKPVYISYHSDKSHMVRLDSLKKVSAVASGSVLPCKYRRTMNDVRANMSIWMYQNRKQVELNLKDNLEKGLSILEANAWGGVEVLVYGHLLGIEIIEEKCETKLFSEEKYVTRGWAGIPVMHIARENLINGKSQSVIQNFCNMLLDFFDTYDNEEK